MIGVKRLTSSRALVGVSRLSVSLFIVLPSLRIIYLLWCSDPKSQGFPLISSGLLSVSFISLFAPG